MAEVSRAALDSTDMDVTESTSYVSGSDNRLDARQYSSTNIFGQTLPYGDTDGPDMYKVIWLNKNDDLNYLTSAGCNHWWDLVNPQYILNHEFGHLAGLSHHTWWPIDNTHTAMKSGCNPGQASLRAEDKNDINDWYD